jgi:hypothetical protein
MNTKLSLRGFGAKRMIRYVSGMIGHFEVEEKYVNPKKRKYGYAYVL